MFDFRFQVDETSDLTETAEHLKKHSTTAIQSEKHQKRKQWGLWSDSCGARKLLGKSPSTCRAPETMPPVALGSSPDLSAFTMSLAPVSSCSGFCACRHSSFPQQRIRWMKYLDLLRIRVRTAPPAPMNHVKHLRAGLTEMPFQTWYTATTPLIQIISIRQISVI